MVSGAGTRLISLLVLALVLATGFVLGIAWEGRAGGPENEVAEREAERRAGDRDGNRRREDDGDRRRGRRLIVDRVGLSPVQEARVDSIVDGYRERLDELQDEYRAEYRSRRRELVLRTRDAIRAVLSPEQRARYDTLLARFDRKEDEGRRRDWDRGHPDGDSTRSGERR